eukprot:4833189-Pyramimonas_sp.AAC.1
MGGLGAALHHEGNKEPLNCENTRGTAIVSSPRLRKARPIISPPPPHLPHSRQVEPRGQDPK